MCSMFEGTAMPTATSLNVFGREKKPTTTFFFLRRKHCTKFSDPNPDGSVPEQTVCILHDVPTTLLGVGNIVRKPTFIFFVSTSTHFVSTLRQASAIFVRGSKIVLFIK